MDDRELRARMDGLARRVDGAAAPDLHAARARAARRRTTSALTVGIGITLVGAVLAFNTLRPTPDVTTPRAPDWALPAQPVVWPAADAPADAAWRQDPEQLIDRFAATVLGWTDARVLPLGGNGYALDPPCPPNARCIDGLDVTVVQDDPTGSWSIARVSSPELRIVGDDDPLVLDGAALSFEITMPDYRSAHVGIVATNGCRDASSYEIGLQAGPFDLPVPEPTADDPACSDLGAGYAFVYVTDDTTEPVGDPLLEAAAIEYPWLTIVPIHLVMESSGATPSAETAVLGITCAADGGTTLSSPTVAASADGVHVSLDAGTRFQVDMHEYAPVEADERVLWLEPGAHQVWCTPSNAGQTADPQTFEVTDPSGHWVDPWITCDDNRGGSVDADPIDVVGDPSDEILAAGEEILRSVTQEPGAIVFGGYPASPDDRRVVLIGEDGATRGEVRIGLVRGAWTPEGYSYCP